MHNNGNSARGEREKKGGEKSIALPSHHNNSTSFFICYFKSILEFQERLIRRMFSHTVDLICMPDNTETIGIYYDNRNGIFKL